MSFYNTIHLHGEDLSRAIQSTHTQEEIILRFLAINAGEWSAWDLHQQPNFYHLPITSIRRALTNLCQKGEILSTGMKKGNYGKPVHTYTANAFHKTIGGYLKA